MSAVNALILANVAGFLLQLGLGAGFEEQFALYPLGQGFEAYQVLTYAFLHGGLEHLVFNMLGLWMFGRDIERAIGLLAFLRLYGFSVLFAAVAQLALGILTGSPAATIGASGGVFGVLLAFGMAYPNRTMIMLLLPIPMPAWLCVTLYAVIELVLGITGTQAGVAHFAHLGGMVGAYICLRVWHMRKRR